MQYFTKADPADDSQGELSKCVRYLKLEEGGRNEMCDIAKKYYNDGKVEVRFDFFCTLVTKYGLSIADALSEAKVPAEDQARFVEMYSNLNNEE